LKDLSSKRIVGVYRFRPARRPPAVLRAGMAGGFEVNPQPLNPVEDPAGRGTRERLQRILPSTTRHPWPSFRTIGG